MEPCLDEDSVLAFLEGRITGAHLEAVERHIDGCRGCGELLATAVEAVRAQPRSTPAPRRIGRFEVVSTLGYGATGIVYRARDAARGEWVALKTIHFASSHSPAMLRREIHALSRLRHPDVVRVVEHGVDDGRPWYAMELLSGETLAHFSRRAWARGAAASGQLPQALLVVGRLCAPLAYLHGEGIVHRDLKPQNILLRDELRPVLVDFGLVGHVGGLLGREVPDVLDAQGTPAYMAPEQIQGELIDARTDLYALGCVLYELITGRPPFVGETGAEIMRQHLRIAPIPPSKLVGGVPAALDDLVLGLLQKRPRDRIGHVDDVVDALAALGVPSEGRTRSSRAYVYRSSLLGRDRVVEELTAVVLAGADGHGGMAVVAGESGIGKTYVALEVARRTRRSLQVINGACSTALGARAPLHPLRNLLQSIVDHCLVEGTAAIERIFGERAPLFYAVEPYVLELPGMEPPTDPPAGFLAGGRERLLGALADTIGAYVRERPTLLLLDDLQWCDELTLAFLTQLDPSWLRQHPLFVLATLRSDEIGPELNAFLGRSGLHRVALDRLEPDAIRSLVRDMLAVEEVPDPLAAALARHSAGNPFFVAEYLRAMVADGALERVSSRRLHLHSPLAEGAGADLALPPSLRAIVSRRLSGIPRDPQALLRAAATLGRELDPELLRTVAALSDTALNEGLSELLHRQVIEPRPDGSYRFGHDKLREIVYDGIAPETKRQLHERAGLAIERRHTDPTNRGHHYYALAHHWLAAGNDAKALEYVEQSAEHALQTFAYREALQLFGQALTIGMRVGAREFPAARRARALHGMARAHFGLGHIEDFEQRTREALQATGHTLPQTDAGWRVLLVRQLIVHLMQSGRGRIPPHSDAATELRLAATAVGLLSHRYFYDDDAVKMLASALLSVNAADRLGEAPPVPRASALMGVLASLARRDQAAARHFERARASATAHHDVVEHCLALAVESVAHGNFGRWTAAGEAARAALAVVPPELDPVVYEIAQAACGHVEYFTGEIEAAGRRFDLLLQAARARQHHQHVVWGLFSVARSLVALRRDAEAEPLLIEARRALAKTPELQSEIICGGLLALTLTRLGRSDDARARADETLARIRNARPSGFPPLEGYAALGEAYWELLQRGAGPRRPLLRDLRRLARASAAFAFVFPVATPVAWLQLGRLCILGGRGGEMVAVRAFRRSADAAARARMPLYEARARLAQAERMRPGVGRDAVAAHAQSLFGSVGCRSDAARIASSFPLAHD